jgi:hypothetical protein
MSFWIKLFFSHWRVHLRAFEEVFIVFSVSIVPLWLLAVVDQLKSENPDIRNIFKDAISSGQLYLYSFSLLGIICWLIWKDHENLDRFPPRKYLALLAFVASVVIVAVYSKDPTMSRKLSPVLIEASVAIYALYNVLYYVLLVFDNLPPPTVSQQLATEAQTLGEAYENQHSGGAANG